MAFFQSPPELGNQYDDDATAREYVARAIPDSVRADYEREYRDAGALAGGALHDLQRADLASEPVHVPWDAWGHRVDRIEHRLRHRKSGG